MNGIVWCLRRHGCVGAKINRLPDFAQCSLEPIAVALRIPVRSHHGRDYVAEQGLDCQIQVSEGVVEVRRGVRNAVVMQALMPYLRRRRRLYNDVPVGIADLTLSPEPCAEQDPSDDPQRVAG